MSGVHKMNANINIKNIYIHKYVTEARDWKCPMPRKEHFLAYQKAGCVVHTMNDGREFAAVPDTVIFLNNKDGYNAHAVEFGYSIVAGLELENAPDSFLIDCSGDNTISGLFNAMYGCRNLRLTSNYYKVLGTIYEIFGLISRYEESEYMQSSTEGKLYAVRLGIQEQYSDHSLSLEKLAVIAGMSPHQMGILFKKKFGVPCWQYVIDTRIEAAAKLLLMPGYSVGMVAEQCGFQDVYYFSRMFKKHMGVSPREYRIND